jgi:predicted membrane channel-forming protein YqfA (hemolysin III family)
MAAPVMAGYFLARKAIKSQIKRIFALLFELIFCKRTISALIFFFYTSALLKFYLVSVCYENIRNVDFGCRVQTRFVLPIG